MRETDFCAAAFNLFAIKGKWKNVNLIWMVLWGGRSCYELSYCPLSGLVLQTAVGEGVQGQGGDARTLPSPLILGPGSPSTQQLLTASRTSYLIVASKNFTGEVGDPSGFTEFISLRTDGVLQVTPELGR